MSLHLRLTCLWHIPGEEVSVAEEPEKRWLPRDVHWGGVEELERERVVQAP